MYNLCNLSQTIHILIYKCASLFLQAALKQKELEKSVQWAQENDKTLRQIQDSLANTDRHLSAYLADHLDAQQIPQEAQVSISVPCNGITTYLIFRLIYLISNQ